MNFYEFYNYINENKEDFVIIKLTDGEKNAADWALDAMIESKDELFDEDAILPEIKNNTLIVFKNKDVIEDMIYRLSIQARDMFDSIPKDHEDYDEVFIKSGKSLSNKLKKILF